jgi:hypothetical protein
MIVDRWISWMQMAFFDGIKIFLIRVGKLQKLSIASSFPKN